MLHFIAQASTYDYSSVSSDGGSAAGGAMFILLVILLGLGVYLIQGIALWKMFEKAGRPGWPGLVPIYNYWVLAELVGKPGWWALVPLAGAIPLVGFIPAIAGFVLMVLICIETAKCFGKDPAYAALLVLLPIVGFPMLGFGSAKYTAPAHVGPSAVPPAPTAPTPAA